MMIRDQWGRAACITVMVATGLVVAGGVAFDIEGQAQPLVAANDHRIAVNVGHGAIRYVTQTWYAWHERADYAMMAACPLAMIAIVVYRSRYQKTRRVG